MRPVIFGPPKLAAVVSQIYDNLRDLLDICCYQSYYLTNYHRCYQYNRDIGLISDGLGIIFALVT